MARRSRSKKLDSSRPTFVWAKELSVEELSKIRDEFERRQQFLWNELPPSEPWHRLQWLGCPPDVEASVDILGILQTLKRATDEVIQRKRAASNPRASKYEKYRPEILAAIMAAKREHPNLRGVRAILKLKRTSGIKFLVDDHRVPYDTIKRWVRESKKLGH
jgi:hypothetical protein